MTNRIFFILFLFIFTGTTLSSQEVELMSYNIKFANETDGENSWSKRQDHITKQIRFYEPQIFGVQEALVSQLKHFESKMKNYKYVGVGRDDGKKAGEFSAIFYNSAAFEVLENDTFWLSETPNEISVGWDAAMERVCTYAKFKEKKSGKVFWVFNTHFDHVGEKARENSAKLIWEKISALNKENLPVILMGDLNLEPDTSGIQFLMHKMNDSKAVAKLDFGPEGTFNAYNFNEPVNRRIDYIFTSDNIEVKKYAVLSDSKDLKYPSDHLPVFVRVDFK
ncbi:endonuclease/exonuclease/phosphatase family protein [Salegentibacter salegens]|uniref:Metal-dependent hydrolase, endonuclease/exonuclease/phosphatase family n=1 Tax=Salegentibacter salegens TaxID=143223 RepID=A0A1M7KP25_9FLAO|nr:endonuclease/exonuclease/phosphatase family protein [Salegentibacter salegens]PRX48866.1 endonuclease/exonuclease/phosphatase family metal-dependent hydrolase [Salegentibacter salegens]SHM67178.1 Metal-dependent hydrolase, endonuclease/exonuclease/phosphatase family [Salegentibacter salegens]